MASTPFPPKTHRFLMNDVYAKVVEMIPLHTKVSFNAKPHYYFHKVGDKIFLKTLTKEIEVFPFSVLESQIPDKFKGYGYGEGEEHMRHLLENTGLSESWISSILRHIYQHVPEWVLLPTSLIKAFPTMFRNDRFFLPPGTLQTAADFADWVISMQADDEIPRPKSLIDPKVEAEHELLRESRRTFNKKYILMREETFQEYVPYVKNKPGGSYTKESVLCKGLLTVRAEGDRIFASAEEFESEREFVSSAGIQDHLPEHLKGFGYGDGPENLYNRLHNKDSAEDVVNQIYSLIDASVILPEQDVALLNKAKQGNAVFLSANMIKRANDFAIWLNA